MENTNTLLESVYITLGYSEGELLPATEYPSSDVIPKWLDKGDWLALASKVGKNVEGATINKVFFVDNDPVIVFGECVADENAIKQVFQRAWCMARPNLLFLALPGEVRVYNLNKMPQRDHTGWKNPEPLEIVKSIAEVSGKLYAFRREQIECGCYLEDKQFIIEGRADRQLIHDLKTVRKELMLSGLEGPNIKYAHSIIGRSIFIRYLEDRGILTEEYFRLIAANNNFWHQMLDMPLEGYDINDEIQKGFYLRVLGDKDFSYALFRQLTIDFNGDIFPEEANEQNVISDEHLKMVQRFMRGDTGSQGKLFFWAYKFDVIPTELISSIYEEFYHKEQQTEKEVQNKDTGTHYTPAALVELVLAKVLTPECLSTNPRVLDPACGSGIFLVEAFRRIVRYQVQRNSGKMLDAEQLLSILQNQIAGIEINEEAIAVAAFSLCLAFLNYLDPPDILEQIRQGRRLPTLQQSAQNKSGSPNLGILLKADSFDIESYIHDETMRTKFNHECADLVVGNPPWGKADISAIKWCEKSGRPLGDFEYSQAFIWRSLDLLKKNGKAGLLVTSGVFFNQASNAMRQQWLCETELIEVINFAHVRDVFFNDSIAPFVFVEFRKSKNIEDNYVNYWSAKKSGAVDGQLVAIFNKADLHLVKQRDLQSDDKLWKIYWWGNHKDRRLIRSLSMNTTLGHIVKYREWKKGHGFQGPTKKGKNYPSDPIRKFKELPTRSFLRYGPLKKDGYLRVPDEVYRFGQPKIYEGWRILIKRGITQVNGANGLIYARLEDHPFCFRHSIFGINLDDAEDWERKILLGILWSSLARYYLFFTSSSWGLWHDSVHLVDEVFRLPIRFPDEGSLREQLVSVVDRLRVFIPQKGKTMIDTNQKRLEKELDELIFDLYELTDFERDLINDLVNLGFDLLYNDSKSSALQKLEAYPHRKSGVSLDLKYEKDLQKGLEGYLKVFLDIWNQYLEPNGEFFWRTIGIASGYPMIAVVFSIKEIKEAVNNNLIYEESDWESVLKQLDSSLLTPYKTNRIYIDGMIRAVSETDIIIIKRNEKRLWTRSMAQEDAEATLMQAMNIQRRLR